MLQILHSLLRPAHIVRHVRSQVRRCKCKPLCPLVACLHIFKLPTQFCEHSIRLLHPALLGKQSKGCHISFVERELVYKGLAYLTFDRYSRRMRAGHESRIYFLPAMQLDAPLTIGRGPGDVPHDGTLAEMSWANIHLFVSANVWVKVPIAASATGY